MERYYLVRLDSNTPEHKMEGLDKTFTREVHLQFGVTATVFHVESPLLEGLRMLHSEYGGDDPNA